MFADLSDIDRTDTSEQIPLLFWVYLLFHVVNLLFNVFLWANSSKDYLLFNVFLWANSSKDYLLFNVFLWANSSKD